MKVVHRNALHSTVQITNSYDNLDGNIDPFVVSK